MTAAVSNRDVPSIGQNDLSSNEGQPPAKKPKVNDVQKNVTSQSGRRGGNLKQVQPRSPLPKCVNRVVNPGAPDKPSERRSSAQVAEDKRRRDELKRNLEALKQREVEIMAEMEVQQEMADEEEEQSAVKTLAEVENIEDDVQMEPIEDATDSETNDTEVECQWEEPPKAARKSMVGHQFPVIN
jgi:hypothetical protein